jgi:hypothetical protein
VSRTVDFHQHLWPPELIAELRARSAPPRLRGSTLELPSNVSQADVAAHDPEERLKSLDCDGIDAAVVSCPPSLELDSELLAAYHEGIVRVAAESGGRIIPLATGEARDGFAGTCVAARALLDLDSLAPLADELVRRNSFLFVHPGPESVRDGEPPWWSAVVGYAAQMQAAYAAWIAHGLERWPGLRVVFAILAGGAPIQLERLASRGLDTRRVLHANVFLDTASYAERALGFTLRTYGIEQVVYGSDWPVISTEATLRGIRSFGEATAAVVCGDNAERLLA